jgi:adenylate cyclase
VTRSTVIAAALIGALVLAGVLGLRAAGWLQPLELAVYDQYLRHASRAPEVGSSSPVLMLEITEQDIREQGHWPLSDHTLAEALRALLEAGVRAIGLDIYRDLPVPPGERQLEKILREEPRVVAVRKSGDVDSGGIPGPPVLEGSDRVGFNDILLDPDSTVRRGLLFLDDGEGAVEYAFGLRVALAALAHEEVFPAPDPAKPDWLRLGSTTLRPFAGNDGGYAGEDDAGYQFMLDFAGAEEGFRSITLGPLLRREVAPELLRDKIVLIGVNARSLPDHFAVPFLGESETGIPGLQVHGHVVRQLVRFGLGESTPLRVLSEGQEALLIALLAALGCLVGLTPRGGPVLGVSAEVLTVLFGGVLLWLGGALAFRLGWWIPVVGPGLAWLSSVGVVTAWSSSRERELRGVLMQLFSRHVSPKIADEVWRQRDFFFHKGRPRSERLTATVLFLDMKGYTGRAEKMDPEQLMEWVNEFMESMASQVDAFGGVVDDYFGDGLKANFGVPFARTSEAEIADDARRAVSCALAMREALESLNAGYRERGLPNVAARIGIHTGPVVAGSVGSAERLKYTVVGDVVITAQRLEGTDRVPHDFERTPCRILASEATRRHLDGSFRCEPQGVVPLKGKEEEVAVYRVAGRESAAVAGSGSEPMGS